MRNSNYKIENGMVLERIVIAHDAEENDGWRELKDENQVLKALQELETRYNTAVFNLERGREELAKVKEYVRGIDTVVDLLKYCR